MAEKMLNSLALGCEVLLVHSLLSHCLQLSCCMLMQVLELMVDNLLDKFSARSVDQMIQRLRQGRGKQYQLGKSGM